MNVVDRIRVRIVDAGQRTLSLLLGCTSRTAEYEFVWKNLPAVGSTILDVGCRNSLLALRLARSGYKVHGIDIRPYSEKHPNLMFVQSDIFHLPFGSDFFDTVIAVSTIEHIGFGLYGDPLHEKGDFKAVQEIFRILKVGGRFIVTIPFTEKYKLAKWQGGVERYYDASTLYKLFSSFEIKAQEFFVGRRRFSWVSVSEEEASNPNLRWHANAALLLVKGKLS